MSGATAEDLGQAEDVGQAEPAEATRAEPDPQPRKQEHVPTTVPSARHRDAARPPIVTRRRVITTLWAVGGGITVGLALAGIVFGVIDVIALLHDGISLAAAGGFGIVGLVDAGLAAMAEQSGPLSPVLGAVPLLLTVLQLAAFCLGAAVAFRPRIGRIGRAFGVAVIVCVVAGWAIFWAVALNPSGSGASGLDHDGRMLVATLITIDCVPAGIALVVLLGRTRDQLPRRRRRRAEQG